MLQLYWGVKGVGRFRLGDKTFRLGAGDVFYYLPGDSHDTTPESSDWEFRWLTMDGPLAVQVTQSFGLAQTIVPSGACPEALFDRLDHEIRDISPAGQRRAAGTVFKILTLVGGGSKETSHGRDEGPLTSRAIEIMREEFSDAGLNVSVLAERLGTHRATLSRQFRRETGLTCINYLITIRVQKGLGLLRKSVLPVAEIARRCGFSNGDYFCKAVLKATGHTPSGFRKL